MGVDPGLNGAMATLDTDTMWLDIVDMPTWHMPVGRKFRQRVDAVALAEHFDLAKAQGCRLVLMEAVGGRPRQSAPAAFQFGYCVGLIYMACMAARLPIETAPPMLWKKMLNVPGKREIKRTVDSTAKASAVYAAAIVSRADEIFPQYASVWRGPRGGLMLDRAEAALLARYAMYIQPKTNTLNIQQAEWDMVYSKKADTGA